MAAPRLIIVCGVPGSGKSTLARHMVDRWGGVSFASEAFAASLGAAARSASGDLTAEAIAHAYAAMAEAVTGALSGSDLVLAIGSFRSELQRRRFREVAAKAGAAATTLRILTSAPVAAERIRLRMASGERGPTENSIRQIDAELNRATDIDITLANDGPIEDFLRRADSLVQSLVEMRRPR